MFEVLSATDLAKPPPRCFRPIPCIVLMLILTGYAFFLQLGRPDIRPSSSFLGLWQDQEVDTMSQKVFLIADQP